MWLSVKTQLYRPGPVSKDCRLVRFPACYSPCGRPYGEGSDTGLGTHPYQYTTFDVSRLSGTYVKMMADFQEPDIPATILQHQSS